MARWIAAATLAGALPLCVLALLDPSRLLLHEPLVYYGDGFAHGVVVKTVLEVGWFPGHNPRLGAPFGAETLDYPLFDAANLLIVKLLGMFSGDWIVVTNAFFLASFALAGVSACAVMAALGMRRWVAVVGATLFALLPFHFLRAQHLFLAAYWPVPLGIYLAVACGPDGGRLGAWARRGSSWPRVLLAAMVGCGGIYYALFSAILVAASGIANVAARRRLGAIVPALVVTAVIGVATAAQLVPSLRYWSEHGRNPQAVSRGASEAERFALKPIQLLLPNPEHRWDAARALARRYAESAPLVNENATAALGFAGSIGLLSILLYGLRRVASSPPAEPPLESLAFQAFVCLALGTMGGVGSALALAGFAWVRGYNRVSVFLGFIGITALLLIAQKLIERRVDVRMQATALAFATGVIALVAIPDQVPASAMRPDSAYLGDRSFFDAVERALPPATAVYEMPYRPYPEAGTLHALDDYELSRGYLNTRTLRWSYGAMKGRAGDDWLALMSLREPEDQVDLAARSGFGAIYLDRRGYVDAGAVDAALRRRLGSPIAQSDDGHRAVYRVPPAGTTPVPREALLLPVFGAPIAFTERPLPRGVSALSGFSGVEPTGRWTEGPLARIEFEQPLPSRFALRVDTAMAMPPTADVDLPVRIGGVVRTMRLRAGASTAEVEFDSAPAARAIDFVIPNPVSPRELGMGPDPRQLGFALRSLTVLPRDR